MAMMSAPAASASATTAGTSSASEGNPFDRDACLGVFGLMNASFLCVMGGSAASCTPPASVLPSLLQPPHLGITPVGRQQMRVRAALDDASVLHHQNFVRV